MLVSLPWVKYIVAGICALAFLVPVVIRTARSRGEINAEKVCSILRKRGFTPVVDGDEIRWTSNGKECILRVRSQCQVEITREYDLPPIPAAIEGNQKVAVETMKEVYLAKVAVKEDNGNNRLAFSTESCVCPPRRSPLTCRCALRSSTWRKTARGSILPRSATAKAIKPRIRLTSCIQTVKSDK